MTYSKSQKLHTTREHLQLIRTKRKLRLHDSIVFNANFKRTAYNSEKRY